MSWKRNDVDTNACGRKGRQKEMTTKIETAQWDAEMDSRMYIETQRNLGKRQIEENRRGKRN